MGEHLQTIQADVVIVGSGPGGATMARELTRRGKKVILCEAGRYNKPRRLTISTTTMMDNMGFTFSKEGTWVVRPKTVGGASVVFCGTARKPQKLLPRAQCSKEKKAMRNRDRSHRAYCGAAVLIVFLVLMACANPQQGYAAEPAKAIALQDIGDNLFGSAMVTEKTYVMAGDRGKIYRSEDGGQRWNEIASGTRVPLFSVSFPDASNGWIAGTSGVILHSADGGKSWVGQVSGTEKHLFSIVFPDPRHGCAVGDWGAVVVTQDGGVSWQSASLEEDVIMYGVAFSGALQGWMVGEFGRIFKTEDGGRVWGALVSPVEQSLFCVYVDGDSVYAGGLDGVILYSRDKGQSWVKAESVSENSIYGIVVKGETGWAVGDSGTVLSSRDGGASWQAQEVPSKKKLFWVGTVNLAGGSDAAGFGAGAHGLYFSIKGSSLTW